jgi:hypothetical protein
MDRNDQWGRREWDGPPESVAVDEMGYQSGGALSDGPTFSAALLAEHGYNSNTMRSSSSVGSHGSGERHAAHFRQPIRDMLPYLMNGETRFPTAFYPASEAAKSDIATVCSGSITEDIEVASVLSADYNVAQIPNNLLPSPPSSERSARPGNRRTASGGRVEFASLPSSLGLSGVLARQSAMSQDSVVHDMGPPLSRALLLQHPHAQESSSSVRSFGSTAGAGSDNVAHLDTDDCGGSFTDGQEDNPTGMKDDNEETAEAQPKDDSNGAHHPLRNGDSSNVPSNGRVSPGGTVYRGRGVRRYQGRYMNLTLKRFHQNGVNLCGDDSDMASNGFAQNDGYSRDDYTSYDNRGGGDRHEFNEGRRGGRSKSPRARWNNEHHDRRRSPSPGRYNSNGNGGRRKRSRSRSPPQSNGNRSRSPSRRARRSSRSWRSRSKSPNRYKSHRSRGGGERYSSRRNGDTNRNAQRSDTPPRYRRRHRNNGGRSSSR